MQLLFFIMLSGLYLQFKGTRDERVRVTVGEMGPPVLNGAFSTFLSFILLAGSESHVFESFFKVGIIKWFCPVTWNI